MQRDAACNLLGRAAGLRCSHRNLLKKRNSAKEQQFPFPVGPFSAPLTALVIANWIVVGVARISVSFRRLDLFPQIDTFDLGFREPGTPAVPLLEENCRETARPAPVPFPPTQPAST